MSEKQSELDTEWLIDQLVELIREKVCQAMGPRLEKLETYHGELQQEVQSLCDEVRGLRGLLAHVEARGSEVADSATMEEVSETP
jgi:hypothetical protein